MKCIRIFLAGMLAISALAYAQTENKAEEFTDAPQPPELPDRIESGQAIEPEISIVRTEQEVIEEYRLNGHLYMIKVTPFVGKPYYLIDQDGDGQMEGKLSDIYNTPRVPQWVLLSW